LSRTPHETNGKALYILYLEPITQALHFALDNREWDCLEFIIYMIFNFGVFVAGHLKTFVRCGKPGYLMPGAFKKHAEHIYNMKVRPDDVWVITFPRSGKYSLLNFYIE
jgi:hypothetical protein